MQLRFAAATILALSTWGISSADEPCRGLSSQLESHNAPLNAGILEQFRSLIGLVDPRDCRSLANVFEKISNRKLVGGKRLEPPRPVDRAEAQKDLDKALADEGVRARIEEARARAPDSGAALLYEATILDATGHAAARDLILERVRLAAKE